MQPVWQTPWSLISLFITLSLVHHGHAQSNHRIFGSPKIPECRELWRNIIKDQNLDSRWFDEEGIDENDDLTWPGLKNTLEPLIVQLPKFFATSKARIRISKKSKLWRSK